MKLFKLLDKIFENSFNNNNLIKIYYRCHRCHQAFDLILRKSYDIQSSYDEGLGYAYVYQKELRDPNCFNMIKIKIFFDRNYKIINHEISGGELIKEEEYVRSENNLTKKE